MSSRGGVKEIHVGGGKWEGTSGWADNVLGGGRMGPFSRAIGQISALQIVYILEFKRSTDKDKGFLEVKDAEANELHKSIISALKAAAPTSGKYTCKIVICNFKKLM